MSIEYSQKLIFRIRYIFQCLFNGYLPKPRGKLDYLISEFDNSYYFWKFRIITEAILKDCYLLGIEVNPYFHQINNIYKFVEFLHSIKEPLKKILLTYKTDTSIVKTNKIINKEQYKLLDISGLIPIIDIIQNSTLKDISIFLHGSMADLTYTAFSDVDDLVIINQKTWYNVDSLIQTARLLSQIARKYQNIDPLQHHGHWVITDFDLLLYDQSYIPLVVFDEAVLISGNSEIKFNLISSNQGFIINAMETIKSISNRLEFSQKQNGINAFNLKCLVGEIVILPAYIFQSKGLMFSKSTAIANAHQIYTEEALQAIIWATKIREEFKPLVNNTTTKLLKKIAQISCSRRHQAEALYRKWSFWISNTHKLGISKQAKKFITKFIEESNLLLK